MADVFMSSAEHILGMCFEIYKMTEKAKSNKTQCRQVGARVRTLERMVQSIKERPENVSPDIEEALEKLAQSLFKAKGLMSQVSKTKAFVSIIKSNSIESKFQEVSQNLTDDIQVLSMALQISHGNTLREGLMTIAARQSTAAFDHHAPLQHQPVPQSPTDMGLKTIAPQQSTAAFDRHAPLQHQPVPQSPTDMVLVGKSPVTQAPPPYSPVSPSPMISYAMLSPPTVVVHSPPPMIYQRPINTVTSTVISYNGPNPMASLKVPQLGLLPSPYCQPTYVTGNTVISSSYCSRVL